MGIYFFIGTGVAIALILVFTARMRADEWVIANAMVCLIYALFVLTPVNTIEYKRSVNIIPKTEYTVSQGKGNKVVILNDGETIVFDKYMDVIKFDSLDYNIIETTSKTYFGNILSTEYTVEFLETNKK